MAKTIPTCTGEGQGEGEAVKQNSDIKLWVGYDKDGQIAEVHPGEAAECFHRLKSDEMTVTMLAKLASEKNKDLLDVKTTTILSVSGSNPCLMMIGNIPVWVC